MATALHPRRGTALIAAIVVLFILECVVLGTLHLALLEDRIAANAETALRLRLAAASAAQSTLADWPAAVEALDVRTQLELPVRRTADLDVHVTITRLGTSLFLIRAVARQQPPRYGRAVASLLVAPPPLPVDFVAAPAALSAALPPGTGPRTRISGVTDPAVCATDGPGLLLPESAPLTPELVAATDGGIGILPEPDAPAVLVERLAAALRTRPDTAALFIDGDYELPTLFTGILVVTGDLHIRAGSEIGGLLFVGGTLHLDADATFRGAAHVAGASFIGGSMTFDGCLVTSLLAASRLHRARSPTVRGSIPGF